MTRQTECEANITQEQIDNLADCFFPAMLAFFESEEGKKKYAEWQETQKRKEQSAA